MDAIVSQNLLTFSSQNESIVNVHNKTKLIAYCICFVVADQNMQNLHVVQIITFSLLFLRLDL